MIGAASRFFFTGDTGYCQAFREIGERYGPFTVAAIPIGAYEPRFIMRPQHIDPEEAVAIHHDLRAQHSLGIHWGTSCVAPCRSTCVWLMSGCGGARSTFVLTDENISEPPTRMRAAMAARRGGPRALLCAAPRPVTQRAPGPGLRKTEGKHSLRLNVFNGGNKDHKPISVPLRPNNRTSSRGCAHTQ